jgi:hypothetical protein
MRRLLSDLLPKAIFRFGLVAALVFLWAMTPKGRADWTPSTRWLPSEPPAPRELLYALVGLLAAPHIRFWEFVTHWRGPGR